MRSFGRNLYDINHIRMNIYTDEVLLAVWQKAEQVDGNDPRVWRKDFAGAWIRYDQYGMRTMYGWQIDHRRPQSKGGTDEVSNLFPLQWENNLEKSDDYPVFSTKITSKGSENVEERQSWKIQSGRRS